MKDLFLVAISIYEHDLKNLKREPEGSINSENLFFIAVFLKSSRKQVPKHIYFPDGSFKKLTEWQIVL